MNNVKDADGFTLVEVMIVVAIIGLLASLALPSFTVMQKRARRSEVPLNLSGIQLAEMAYFSEYGEFHVAPTQPRPDADLDTQKVDFPATAAGFHEIGWSPDSAVIGNYTVDNVSILPPSFDAYGACDVDNDGNIAYYYASETTKTALGLGLSTTY